MMIHPAYIIRLKEKSGGAGMPFNGNAVLAKSVSIMAILVRFPGVPAIIFPARWYNTI